MKYFKDKIVDRQVGRNAELFAEAIAAMDTVESRYPYLRILVGIAEQAHPEWIQAPQKERQISHLIHQLSRQQLNEDEIAQVVRIRDAERGYHHD
jgi:hypothetical protein